MDSNRGQHRTVARDDSVEATLFLHEIVMTADALQEARAFDGEPALHSVHPETTGLNVAATRNFFELQWGTGSRCTDPGGRLAGPALQPEVVVAG